MIRFLAATLILVVLTAIGLASSSARAADAPYKVFLPSIREDWVQPENLQPSPALAVRDCTPLEVANVDYLSPGSSLRVELWDIDRDQIIQGGTLGNLAPRTPSITLRFRIGHQKPYGGWDWQRQAFDGHGASFQVQVPYDGAYELVLTNIISRDLNPAEIEWQVCWPES